MIPPALDLPEADIMRSTTAVLLGFLAGSALFQSAAFADDSMRPRDGQRWWRGEIRQDFWGGPCEMKTGSKPGEFKREIKCKDGVGATWSGEWKTEFRDGPCLIKQDAKRDEFKEEIKCERRR